MNNPCRSSGFNISVKIMTLLFFFFSLLFTSFDAQAVDQNGKFAIKGVGNVTCERFLIELEARSHNSFLFAGWLNGYMTAHGQHMQETFDISSWEDTETLANYLANYCKEHPKRSYYVAVTSMIKALFPDRIQTFSKKTKVKGESKTVVLYTSVLKSAQKKLSEKGFYKGEADGAYGPATKEAFMAFQKNSKLPASGIPDQPTLHKLFGR